MYRLLSPFETGLCSWMFVTGDQTRAVVFAFNTQYYEVMWNYPRLKLRGLREDVQYKVQPFHIGDTYNLSGRTLASAGLLVMFNGDSEALLFILDQI